MDREYLEDYEAKEHSEIDKRNTLIQENKFSFDEDVFPFKDRFFNLQKPIAVASNWSMNIDNVYAQIPFSGSLILCLPAFPQKLFESLYFKASEIPKIIDFIKDTGKLQIALQDFPTSYEGFDYLDPFFKELEPPVARGLPMSLFGSYEEMKNAKVTFTTLIGVRYLNHIKKIGKFINFPAGVGTVVHHQLSTYTFLKLNKFARPITEAYENALIDDPQYALSLIDISQKFIVGPMTSTLSKLTNFTFQETVESRSLPLAYQPKDLRFPCEIGKFLLKKLTYAPMGLRACYDLIDHYADYDLQQVQESLNEAIVTNHPEIVNTSVNGLSEILDNVWEDQTIQKRIKNLTKGIPISMAAIGTSVSAFSKTLEGFLVGMGFNIGAKFLNAEVEGFTESIAKFLARNYQVTIYDFKKKYNGKLVK